MQLDPYFTLYPKILRPHDLTSESKTKKYKTFFFLKKCLMHLEQFILVYNSAGIWVKTNSIKTDAYYIKGQNK